MQKTAPELITEPDELGRAVARSPWSEREKDTLRELFDQNVGDAAIALELPGRSEAAVRIRRHRMNLIHYSRDTRPHRAEKPGADVAELIDTLETIRRIARSGNTRQIGLIADLADAQIKAARL